MRCLAEGSQQPAETSVTISVASLAIGWLKQRLKVLRLASLDAVGLSGPLPWTKNGDLGSRRRSRKLPLSQAHSGGVGPRIGGSRARDTEAELDAKVRSSYRPRGRQ